MTLDTSQNPPFEVATAGSFLMFEVADEVLGFPYAAMGPFTLTHISHSGEGLECLQFVFGNHTIQVSGNNLKRLLLLIHKQELFLVRVGESKDPKFPKIVKIESTIQEEKEEYP